MSKELRDKAQRIIDAYEGMVAILPMMDGTDDVMSAPVDVSRAYLALVPADDDEPVTRDFVESLDGEVMRNDQWHYSLYLCKQLEIRWNGCTLKDGRKVIQGPHCEALWIYQHLPEPKTRGQLRRLLAALGVPTKEKP